jgi:hypothetical protein
VLRQSRGLAAGVVYGDAGVMDGWRREDEEEKGCVHTKKKLNYLVLL